ncbi:MAG: hypothetical protein ACO1OB_21720 [Archangium sp.]
MRKTLKLSMMLLVLCGGTQAFASASFANRSLGLSISGFGLVGDIKPVDWILPIALEGGLYLESGFEVFLRPQFFLARVPINATGPGTAGGIVIGGGGQLGVRYLFLEESIRPYVGLHIAALVFNTQPTVTAYPGVGTQFGCDFFVGESVSLGLRAVVDLALAFNTFGRDVVTLFSLGGGGYVTTYF